MERLQKYLARCGVASRRHAEALIVGGRVTVNGEIRREMGVIVDAERDFVTLDGQPVKPESRHLYIAMNKPTGYITTVSDTHGRRTVMDLLPAAAERLYPVGRLDFDTEGLLLLTNDGDLAFAMTHPRHELTKEYHALVQGVPSETALNSLRQGIMLDGRPTARAGVEIMGEANGNATLRIEIHEGRNRQVRRMCEVVGHRVLRLNRVRIGPLLLGDLPSGQCRPLTRCELASLREALGMETKQDDRPD